MNGRHNRRVIQAPDAQPIENKALARPFPCYGNVKRKVRLASLTDLRVLRLWRADYPRPPITDLSPLDSLSNLRVLMLRNWRVSDTSFLTGLTKLQWLELGNCEVGDLSAVANMTDLRLLEVWDIRLQTKNRIEDISPLAGLRRIGNLEPVKHMIDETGRVADYRFAGHIDLQGSRIKDISLLVKNPGIGQGDEINLRGNPLNDEAYDIHIPALQKRGVKVRFDPRPSGKVIAMADENLDRAIRQTLRIPERPIYESDVAGLKKIYAWGQEIADLGGIEHLIRLDRLELGDNQITDIRPLVHNPGLGSGDEVNLVGNPLNAEAYDYADPLGTLLGSVVGLAIGTLLGAIILRAAAKWVAQMDVPFGRACGIVLIAGLIDSGIGLVVGFFAMVSGVDQQGLAILSIFMLPVGFLILSRVISWRLEVGFSQAVEISLVMILICITIGMVLAGGLFVLKRSIVGF